MNNEQQIIADYQALSRAVAVILNDPDSLTGDRGVLWESFAHNLTAVLKSALDVAVTPEDIRSLPIVDKGTPNDAQMVAFWSKVLERPRAYIVVSYFYFEFLHVYQKLQKNQLGSISPELEERVMNNYRETVHTG